MVNPTWAKTTLSNDDHFNESLSNAKYLNHLGNLESPALAQEDVTDRHSDIGEVDLSVTTRTVLESENTAKWF